MVVVARGDGGGRGGGNIELESQADASSVWRTGSSRTTWRRFEESGVLRFCIQGFTV